MQNQAQATKEYRESLRAIESMMRRLRNDSAKMFTDPRTVHWGHVGDMRRMELKVKDLCDFVFKEGEYENATINQTKGA